jgi:hypothetical protein
LKNYLQISIHIIWIETLIAICQGEERLQTIMSSSENNLEVLCENLAEAGSFYESSLIQMPVRIDWERFGFLYSKFVLDKISN